MRSFQVLSLSLSLCLWISLPAALRAQSPGGDRTDTNTESMNEASITQVGPRGGSLKSAAGIQLETLVDPSGIHVFAYDQQGSPLSVDRGRGAVVLRVEGNAKRYRYDLLPDGKGGLTALVNLSKIAGRQVEIDVQIVGVGSSGIQFREVATVPESEMQLASAAIARQKICPVRGTKLGSMGQPVAVTIDGGKIYVCCDDCVDVVNANPAKFAAGRPEITVAAFTAADAAAIAKQKTCPVMDEPLGSMGKPVKLMVGEQSIFLCCKGCIKKVEAEPAKYVAKVHGPPSTNTVPAGSKQVRDGVFAVTPEDASFVAAQKKCPVMDEPLDAMNGPFKVHAAGKAIYICCPGCAKRIAEDPQKYLTILKDQGVQAPAIR